MKWLPISLVMLFLVPIFAQAQAPETELEIQIRAALQEQANEQGYTAQELDELAAALAQNAQEEGISAEDVSQTYGFAPESFETEEEETALVDGDTVASAGATNPIVIVGGVLFLGFLAWALMRFKHAPVSETTATPPVV